MDILLDENKNLKEKIERLEKLAGPDPNDIQTNQSQNQLRNSSYLNFNH